MKYWKCIIPLISLMASSQLQSQPNTKELAFHKYLVTKQHLAATPVPQLDSKSIHEDILYLREALATGYAGFDYLGEDRESNFLEKLDSIAKHDQSISSLEFCQKIGKVLQSIPDNHLTAYTKDKNCTKRSRKVSQIGQNLAANKERPWHLEIRKQSGRSIVVLAISRFPAKDSPVWEGMIKKLKESLAGADGMILDLRRNNGGLEQIGMDVAAVVYGTADFPQPVERLVFNTHPNSKIFFSNIIMQVTNGNREVPNSLSTEYLRNIGEAYTRSLAIDAPFPAEEVEYPLHPLKPKKLFPGFVKILIGSGCGSACEIVVDYFEYFPRIQLIGQATAGTRHFGNVGLIVLPHSKIRVRVPGYYIKYRDNRFIEKSGIKPHLAVENDIDALVVAMDDSNSH